jgi:hypothetical protein
MLNAQNNNLKIFPRISSPQFYIVVVHELNTSNPRKHTQEKQRLAQLPLMSGKMQIAVLLLSWW